MPDPILYILWAFLGIIVGVIAGLLPGLHPNSTIPIILSFSALLSPIETAVFLIASGVTNSFVSFIPSILLGAPEDDSSLSVLPGHRLLLEGRGYEAVKLTVIGGLGAMFFVLLTLPAFMYIVPGIYAFIRPHTHVLLIFVVAYMIFREPTKKKIIIGAVVFLLSGLLGIFTLGEFSNDALFPVLSGLFGLPMLLLNFRRKTTLPETFTLKSKKLSRGFILSGLGIGSLAGIIAGLLPGIGSAQSTVLSQEVSNITSRRQAKGSSRKFLISFGSVNTADIIYSLLAIWLIGRARSGIAVAVDQLLEVTFSHILLFLPLIFITSVIAAYLTLRISKEAVFSLKKVNYSRLSIYIFFFIYLLIALFAGVYGIIIATIAMLIGLIPNLTGVKRSHSMGVLILPTILFFMNMSV